MKKIFILCLTIITALTTPQTCIATNQELQEAAKIYALSISAAIAYAILQDQVTYRNCPEYFTKNFHKDMMDQWEGIPILNLAKKLFDNNPDSPTIRATIWGTVASWWMGAILGIPITMACRLGPWQKLTYKDIVQPLALTMTLTGICSAYAGFNKNSSLKKEKLKMLSILTAMDQPEKGTTNAISTKTVDKILHNDIPGVDDQHGFKVNAAAHSTAYIAGPICSLGLILYILKTRYNLSR